MIDPEYDFQRAFEYHQSGDLSRAESMYLRLLQHDPQNENVTHLLSILYGQQGRYEDALQCIQEAVILSPDSATFYNTYANIERHLGNIDNAIEHYQKALSLAPESASTNNNLGILYYQQGQYDNAVMFYRIAIKLKPDYADAYYNLGNALTQQGKFDEAIKTLETALKYQPDHPQIHTHLAQLLLRLERYSQAIQHCRVGLTLDPNNPELHHQLAVALTHEDKYEEAVEHYRDTLKQDPGHVEALHNLGALYVLKRESDLALTCYLRLLVLAPDVDTYYNLGVIYFYQDRHNDAINYLSEVLKLDPNHFNTHLNLGASYIKKEDLKKAAEHYQAALVLKPGDAQITYILSAITQEDLPETAPAGYIENLFDQYAPHFDQHLKQYLEYHVPDLLLKAVMNLTGVKEADWQILDLGCGTGLCGEKFKPLAHRLIGVDLSEKMLEAANVKDVYDALEKFDIHQALQNHTQLDLVIAGDVLGYVGSLDALFPLVKSALKEKGMFVFTVEKGQGEDYALQRNARFAHSKKYIEKLAEANGLEMACEENAILRMQKSESVEGYVFVLVQSGVS